MATYAVIPPRRLFNRPAWPYRLNYASPHAVGLLDVFAGDLQNGGHRTLVGQRPITVDGTFDVPQGRPAPIMNVCLQNNQAGGNGAGQTFSGITGSSTTDGYTISCWLYEAQAPVAARGIWSFGSDPSTWSIGLGANITTGSSGKLMAYVVTTSGGAAQYDTGETQSFGAFTWRNAVVVWKPGSGLFLYVNGYSEASNTTTTTTLRNVDSFKVFGTNRGGVTNGWDGSIVDLRLYNRAFSDDEVRSLYTDPWDLYAVPSRRVYFNVGALGGSTWPGYQSPFGWH